MPAATASTAAPPAANERALLVLLARVNVTVRAEPLTPEGCCWMDVSEAAAVAAAREPAPTAPPKLTSEHE